MPETQKQNLTEADPDIYNRMQQRERVSTEAGVIVTREEARNAVIAANVGLVLRRPQTAEEFERTQHLQTEALRLASKVNSII